MKKRSSTEVNENYLIIQLSRIVNQLMLANYFVEKVTKKLPTLVITGTEKYTGLEENQALLDILFDHIIIQLYQFLEIEPFIQRVEAKTYPHHELTKSLKEIVKPIRKMEGKIRLWRNNIVTHSKQQVFNFVPFHILDPDYMETLRNINLLSRLAVCYLIGLFVNIPDYTLAMVEKHNLGRGVEADTGFKEWWFNMKKTEKEIVDKANNELKKSGFEIIKRPSYKSYPIGSD